MDIQKLEREFYEGKEVGLMHEDYCCHAVVSKDSPTGHQIVINSKGQVCINLEVIEGPHMGEISPFEFLLVESLMEGEERLYEGVERSSLPSEEFRHYQSDIERIRKVCFLRDRSITQQEAMVAWKKYSSHSSAGWLTPPRSDETLFQSVEPHLPS